VAVQQLVVDEPGGLEVDLDGVEVQHRHAELLAGGPGDVPRVGQVLLDQVGDDRGVGGLLRLGLGFRRDRLIDDAFLDQASGKAGKPGLHRRCHQGPCRVEPEVGLTEGAVSGPRCGSAADWFT
jgi:hypothetical protein